MESMLIQMPHHQGICLFLSSSVPALLVLVLYFVLVQRTHVELLVVVVVVACSQPQQVLQFLAQRRSPVISSRATKLISVHFQVRNDSLTLTGNSKSLNKGRQCIQLFTRLRNITQEALVVFNARLCLLEISFFIGS